MVPYSNAAVVNGHVGGPVALKAGATMVRLGRILFGERPALDSICRALVHQQYPDFLGKNLALSADKRDTGSLFGAPGGSENVDET